MIHGWSCVSYPLGYHAGCRDDELMLLLMDSLLQFLDVLVDSIYEWYFFHLSHC